MYASRIVKDRLSEKELILHFYQDQKWVSEQKCKALLDISILDTSSRSAILSDKSCIVMHLLYFGKAIYT
jgi:hypothetical protein